MHGTFFSFFSRRARNRHRKISQFYFYSFTMPSIFPRRDHGTIVWSKVSWTKAEHRLGEIRRFSLSISLDFDRSTTTHVFFFSLSSFYFFFERDNIHSQRCGRDWYRNSTSISISISLYIYIINGVCWCIYLSLCDDFNCYASCVHAPGYVS